jgi:phytoene desaturase
VKGKTAIVIGSGFAGLSAASFLAQAGWEVTVVEKHEGPGGRARQLKESGFTFDMGPSFYWMPDVFEKYFSHFNRKVTDYYSLERLDPSYRIYWDDGILDFPANLEELKASFEALEPGSAASLDRFLAQAGEKYRVGMQDMVYKPGLSLLEYMNWRTIRGAWKLNLFTSIRKHIAKHFQHPRIRRAMEFPVLFLGALPENTPSLYSLMNYADIVGGTWYPRGGMYSVVEGMFQLAKELGVHFRFNEEVVKLNIAGKSVESVQTARDVLPADVVVSSADYHFTETKLLDADNRNYSVKFWQKKVMAPSCLLYYVGLNRKLATAVHHGLFFDVPFEPHAKDIYERRAWPREPLFYVSVASKTDPGCAPEGHENLVLLVPVAAGLEGDDEHLRDHYFDLLMTRLERKLGEELKSSVVFCKTYSVSDFSRDYHSYRGNAYGLANTLRQTGILRPSCRNRKIPNLYYAGQLTVPGPGVPPSLISGEVVANEINKRFNIQA